MTGISFTSQQMTGKAVLKLAVHIVRFLSQRNRILYIESIGMRTPKASANDMKRIASKLSLWCGGLRRIDKNFYVYTPIVIPFHDSEVVRKLNKQIMIASVKRLQKRLHMDNPISWVFHPQMGEVSGHFGSR